jgi:hypothetical protein
MLLIEIIFLILLINLSIEHGEGRAISIVSQNHLPYPTPDRKIEEDRAISLEKTSEPEIDQIDLNLEKDRDHYQTIIPPIDEMDKTMPYTKTGYINSKDWFEKVIPKKEEYQKSRSAFNGEQRIDELFKLLQNFLTRIKSLKYEIIFNA